MNKGIFFIILAMILMGCSPQKKAENKKSSYTYSVEELVRNNGEPNKKTKNLINEKYQMYHYKDKVYQIDQDKVMASFRDPKDKEKHIQYWRHLFENDFYKIKLDEKSSSSHNQLQILNCPAKGITIYFRKDGKVLRISKSMRTENE